MSSLPILQSLPEGSSGTGISHYSQGVSCSRRLRYQQESRALQEEHSPNYRPDVGKVYHALQELYHSTGQKNIAVELSHMNLGEAPDEARRLFSGYTERFSPLDFSRVIATELLLPAEGNAAQAAAIAAAVGVSPFTCRLDMAVEIDERTAAVQYKKRGLMLEEGSYLWDHKSKGSKGGNDEMVYRYAPQGLAYLTAAIALQEAGLLPAFTKPIKGMVFDCVVTHKTLTDNSFYSILVSPPTASQVAGLQGWLRYAQKAAANDEPNWLACFDFAKACPYLLRCRS